MRGVPITGLSVLHQAGQDIETFWTALLGQKTLSCQAPGVLSLESVDFDAYFNEDEARRMDRISQICTLAVRRVIETVGESALSNPGQVGLCVGTDLGTVDSIIRFSVRVMRSGPNRANPMEFPNTVLNAPSGHACIHTGLKGYNNTVVGPGALAEAFDALTLNRAEAVVVAGIEEASDSQRQIQHTYSKVRPVPLSQTRAGYWIGEGAACAYLEQPQRAVRYKRHSGICYCGYGMTFDGEGLIGKATESQYLAAAIEGALHRADIGPDEVEGVVLSADGHVQADEKMIRSLSLVFREKLATIPLFAFPGYVGNMLGANEGFGLLCSSLILKNGIWPGSPWFEQDPQLPLLNVAKESKAFGGRVLLLIVADMFGVNSAHIISKV